MKVETPLRPVWLALLIGLAAVPVASAGVPSPANCTLPDCIHCALDGTLLTSVAIRDLANNPVNNSTVTFVWADCPDFVPCPSILTGVDAYTVDLVNKRFITQSGGNGVVAIYLRGGGGCPSTGFRIYADGILLGTRREASDDQNGDLVVDATDVALITAKVGTSDLSGDLNCDGVVDSGHDVAFVQGRFGTICEGPVPARPTSWGHVKILYR